MNKINDIYYIKVAGEIENGTIDKGWWTRAIEMSPDDANRIKSNILACELRS